MTQASPEDRAYFERVERANRELDNSQVPRSLAEMFDRLEQTDRLLGPLAAPGVTAGDEGDLSAHLVFIDKARRARTRGTSRS